MHYLSSSFEDPEQIVNRFSNFTTYKSYKKNLANFLEANKGTLALPVNQTWPVKPNCLYWIPEHSLDSYDNFEITTARTACYNVNKHPAWNRFQLKRLFTSQNSIEVAWAKAEVHAALARNLNHTQENVSFTLDDSLNMVESVIKDSAQFYHEHHIAALKNELGFFKDSYNLALKPQTVLLNVDKEIMQASYKKLNTTYAKSIQSFLDKDLFTKSSILVANSRESILYSLKSARLWLTDPVKLDILTRIAADFKIGNFFVGIDLFAGGLEAYSDHKQGLDWQKKFFEVEMEIIIAAGIFSLITYLFPGLLIAAIIAGVFATIISKKYGKKAADFIYEETNNWSNRIL